MVPNIGFGLQGLNVIHILTNAWTDIGILKLEEKIIKKN